MDTLTKEERSARMAKVKAKGNKSTEATVAAKLRAAHITGWRRHPRGVLGKPDFYFPTAKLVLFVDGCFWHACPTCGRIPKSRIEFWRDKIDGNRRRDNRTRKALRRRGFRVYRVWEHEASTDKWLERLQRALADTTKYNTAPLTHPKGLR